MKNAEKKFDDATLILIRDAYLDHIASGQVRESFNYRNGDIRCHKRTVDRFIRERPDIFDEDSIDFAEAKRFQTMLQIGIDQATGKCSGSSPSWKFIMQNMFGWRERTDNKQEHSLSDQFHLAVKSQEATNYNDVSE